MVRLTPYTKSVIVGLILSDGWLIIASKTTKNARLGFKQSADHLAYVLFIFNLLSHYCSSSPHVTTGIRSGTRFYALEFFTRSMPCITELYYLLYPNKVKLIPSNIYELLTPEALAHLIMGDGTVASLGLTLCTDSFTIPDVVKLMNVLLIRYQLECTLHLHRPTQYRIYIRSKSMPKLRSIVGQYMCPTMMYKLGKAK